MRWILHCSDVLLNPTVVPSSPLLSTLDHRRLVSENTQIKKKNLSVGKLTKLLQTNSLAHLSEDFSSEHIGESDKLK